MPHLIRLNLRKDKIHLFVWLEPFGEVTLLQYKVQSSEEHNEPVTDISEHDTKQEGERYDCKYRWKYVTVSNKQ